jgi:hypothetical protein
VAAPERDRVGELERAVRDLRVEVDELRAQVEALRRP